MSERIIIEQHPDTDEWYVLREVLSGKIVTAQAYLHSDGVWRGSCYNRATHRFDGYYPSEEEAKAALAKVNSQVLAT